MVLQTWAPFADFEREMRAMLDRHWPEHFLAQSSPISIPVDFDRDGDDLVITAELPGIDPMVDVNVTVEGDTLIITGEKTQEAETKDDHRFLWERRYGRFERRVGLPDGVDPDAITATYDKGVLMVRVPAPLAETPERRQIPVTAPDA